MQQHSIVYYIIVYHVYSQRILGFAKTKHVRVFKTKNQETKNEKRRNEQRRNEERTTKKRRTNDEETRKVKTVPGGPPGRRAPRATRHRPFHTVSQLILCYTTLYYTRLDYNMLYYIIIRYIITYNSISQYRTSYNIISYRLFRMPGLCLRTNGVDNNNNDNNSY